MSNPHENKIENTTLCYPEQGGSLLMLHRTKKENDINKDKWIGIGGHLEAGESPEDGIRREMMEETGLTAGNLLFRGIVTFVCGNTTEYMYLFTAGDLRDESGRVARADAPLPECDEGNLAWIPWDDVMALPAWEGDRIFLQLLRDNAPFFSLKLVYDEDGRLLEAALDGQRVDP